MAVAMLLVALVPLGRVTPTGWAYAVWPGVLIVLGIWMLRKGARGLRTRP